MRNKIYLTIGFDNKENIHWVRWRYHPEALEFWRKICHYPETYYDPQGRRWVIEDSVLWKQLEWMGEEFGYASVVTE